MDTVTLTFTRPQLGAILQALQDAPFKLAAPVLQSIEMQMQQAMAPRPVAVPTEPPQPTKVAKAG
jgi:hypothetical protein